MVVTHVLRIAMQVCLSLSLEFGVPGGIATWYQVSGVFGRALSSRVQSYQLCMLLQICRPHVVWQCTDHLLLYKTLAKRWQAPVVVHEQRPWSVQLNTAEGLQDQNHKQCVDMAKPLWPNPHPLITDTKCRWNDNQTAATSPSGTLESFLKHGISP